MTLADVAVSLLGGVVGGGLLKGAEAWWAQRRDRLRLAGLVRLLRDEIRENVARFHALGALKVPSNEVEPISTGTYDAFALDFAHHLPQDLRIAVAHAYSVLRRLQVVEPSMDDEARQVFGRLEKEHLSDLDDALGRYMKKLTKGREIEVGPKELAGWQLPDPSTGLTPFEQARRDARGDEIPHRQRGNS